MKEISDLDQSGLEHGGAIHTACSSLNGGIMLVYWVRNIVNDKLYIGQTSTPLERRWYMHTWDNNSNSLLHRAILKHGKENFKIETIHICESKEEMDFVEM